MDQYGRTVLVPRLSNGAGGDNYYNNSEMTGSATASALITIINNKSQMTYKITIAGTELSSGIVYGIINLKNADAPPLQPYSHINYA